jgi:PLP dependent protein
MVASNLAELKERIEKAAKRSRRDPREITLVCVTKSADFKQLNEAVSAGITDIGENRVQDAVLKYNYLGDMAKGRRWHMIGHLQTNKVSKCLKIFDIIHSLDSIKLAREINKHACQADRVVDCFLEVNNSKEASKYGVQSEEAFDFIEQAASLDNLRITGIMSIAPAVDDPERVRPFFEEMRVLRDRLQKNNQDIRELSMGMTQDFEVAIEEGATFVRIGSAVFSD